MDRAQPGAKGSLTHNLEAGAAWGQFSDGWIVPSTQPSRPARGETSIDEAALNAFAETSAADSLTVTIDPGEAFVDGWLARDTSTDVDLAASTNGQTVFAGWDVSAVFSENEHANRDAADTVIVGLEAAFQDLDPKVPLWTFDTDGAGVTSVVDERDLGSTATPEQLRAQDVLRVPVFASKADIPADLPAGTIVFAQQERSFFGEDGTK